MKATMIKKINLVTSLWLIAIIICLCIFAQQLDVFTLYIVAIAVSGLLLASNLITLISGLIAFRGSSFERSREYHKN